MIRFDDVTITYDGAIAPVLSAVDLEVPDGELCLVVGGTGSGKSTLLRAVNGLVPRFSGGTLAGSVRVGGRSTAEHPPRDLASIVGYVGQDPSAGFVTDLVEEELAYVMENLGIDQATMRRRVEDVLDLLGLVRLRGRPLQLLSNGERQRVAIGAAFTAHPSVLVLDEPTSALDPAAAEDVLAALLRLVHDLGTTVLLAEHRLERVVQYADSVIVVNAGTASIGAPADQLAESPVVPPVVELARTVGWQTIPLSVRDARRQADGLREQLSSLRPAASEHDGGEQLLAARRLTAGYGGARVLEQVDFSLGRGEVVAVMGRNGAGKSTLLASLVGLRAPVGGSVEVAGRSPADIPSAELLRLVSLVPSDPGLLLYRDSVGAECVASDSEAGVAPGTTAGLLASIVGEVDHDRHPRDCSEGQRLALALSVVLAAGPPAVLLDEPTRGLDYPAKAQLVAVLDELARSGHGVIVATHDVEFVASVADRAVVLAGGEVVADGPARQVVAHSPVFAPQVAKVVAPEPWMTVREIADALGVGSVAGVRGSTGSSTDSSTGSSNGARPDDAGGGVG